MAVDHIRSIPNSHYLELFEMKIYMESVMYVIGAKTPREALDAIKQVVEGGEDVNGI